MPAGTAREILVTAVTYPELSRRYRESACTGGVFLDSREWCRIYPLPIRYLDERIHRWDVIRARVWETSEDPRPESWRVDPASIERLRRIPTGGGNPPQWEARRDVLFSPERLFSSVEALERQQTKDRTSLGLVTPREGVEVEIDRRPASDRAEWNEKLESLRSQGELFPQDMKALDFLSYRLKLSFRCSGSDCERRHSCVVLDWEMCQMIRREGLEGARERLVDLANAEKYELRLMMGNFRVRPRTFGIVGLWYPKRSPQMPLV